MIGKSVRLCSTEIRLAKHIALARDIANVSNGVKDIRRTPKGEDASEELDLQGFGAELAFCKLFNLFPDFSIGPRSSKEDTGDAVLHCGLTVDVKATKYSTGRLLAGIWKQDDCDLYALMVGKFPEYTFKGFMWKSELRREERVGTLGHGPTYMAEQNELKELSELKNESRLNTRAADCYLQPASNQ